MKIILSRKGSDSAFGGIPSPIFPDGSLCSLPIPSDQLPRLKDIRFRGQPLSKIVEQLLSGKIDPKYCVHLDPDLDQDARPRSAGWLPSFGQVGAAETHLENQNVSKGDLFLFFGWFRHVVMINGKYQYQADAQDIHSLFGWLQIGAIYHPGQDDNKLPKWALDHPHVRYADDYSGYANNTLYAASKQLRLPGLRLPVAGGGIFHRFAPCLQLTEKGQQRSIWRLPDYFCPTKGSPVLSFHSDMHRWRKDGKGVLLQTVGRGQEFVLDCKYYPKVFSWLKEIFQVAPRIGSRYCS